MSFLTIRIEVELYERKNQQLLEELEALKTRVAQVDRLQQENQSLQAEIDHLREIQDAQPVSPIERKPLGELSSNRPTTQQRASTDKVLPSAAAETPDPAKYKAVVARCKQLDIKYKGARKLLEDYRLKLRKRTEAIDAWATYSDSLQSTIDKLQARLKPRPCSTDGGSTVLADEPVGAITIEDVNIAHLTRPRPYSTSTLEIPSSPPLGAISGGKSAPPSPPCLLSEPLPGLPTDGTFRRVGSVTTHETALPTADVLDLPPYPDEPVEVPLAIVKVELSSDVPVIVSTRSARKRKCTGENSADARLEKVKLEHNSSSSGPEIIRESHHYSPAESIDFDEEVHVTTPRKRRALPQSRRKYADTTSEGTQRPRLPNAGYSTSETTSVADKSRPSSHGVAGPMPDGSSPHLDAFPQLLRTGQATKMDKSTETDCSASSLALGIKDLAEDGNAGDGNAGSNQIQRPRVKGRLDALLNSPSIKTRPPITRDAPKRVQMSRPVPFHDGNGGVRFSTVPTYLLNGHTTPRDTTDSVPKSSTGRERAPKKASILRDDMPRGRTIAREDTPLRERPVERLRPEDFKPNPLYNDGLTFVYDEVVRGKDARAALSGCVDPNCCGKTFRHFAEAELKSVGSSVTTRVEDVGLMERYLGDEAFKLGIMTQEEREEAWLKAKTWELANKFGKHRHRYSRMPTPPGFWSVDFPNTQERAEELRQAEEIRKVLVNERHREAMRCKGSWLFRDEEPR